MARGAEEKRWKNKPALRGLYLYFMRIFAGKESTFYELDDVRHVAKKDSDKNISMSEKMTQTDWQMFDRTFSGDLAAATQGIYYYH